MTRSRPALRALSAALAVALGAGALVLGSASAASAHVHVDASNTAAGAYTVLTFRVPTESDTASTVSLDVHLPTDAPFRYVQAEPVPGWDVQLHTTDLAKPLTDDDGNTITSAITEVIWTATGAGLSPQEFGRFSLAVGPLPDTGTTVALPAEQGYSDGHTVGWVQQAAPGTTEPEHPAPSLTTTEASSDTHVHGATAPSTASAGAELAADSTPVSASGLEPSLIVGIAALVLAAAAAAGAGVALSRSRR